MTIYREFAPAKVNLTLEVLGRRADGYHELASLVAFAHDVGDEVSLDTSKPAGSEVSGPFAATIAGQNLIDVTLSKLAVAARDLQLGHVHLVKNLPVAAGIGGGSADAGALLRAVRRANPKIEELIDWQAIARSFGADVPVCFENRSAWMTGIGDRVQPLDALPKLAAVLVNPLHPMPADKTAQVFRTLKARPVTAETSRRKPGPFASAEELLIFMAEHGNALEASACAIAPVIADVKRALSETAGCQYAGVSGGGPTCFGVFADAIKAAADLQRTHTRWWVHTAVLG